MLISENEKPGQLFWTTLSNSKWIKNLHSSEKFDEPLVGYGKSFSSFGEIVQGRLSNNEDFLVTLPIDLWSTCTLICKPIKGPLVIECDLEKSRSLLYKVLEDLGIREGFYIEVNFTRNIPVGKGLSSSTADMLAALRAIQEIFGFLIGETFVSRLFSSIEPHDGVQYNSCVAYNHRTGVLLSNFKYIPQYLILVIDDGGMVDTLQYNKSLTFSQKQLDSYDNLFLDLKEAFEKKDDVLIAQCATKSAILYSEISQNPLMIAVLKEMNRFSPLGIIATHSGTCVGLLYPRSLSNEILNQLLTDIKKLFDKKVFLVKTLSLLT